MSTMFPGKESISQRLYHQETVDTKAEDRYFHMCRNSNFQEPFLQENSGNSEKIKTETIGQDIDLFN